MSGSGFYLDVRIWKISRIFSIPLDQPERAPDALLADKGYGADAIRAGLAARDITAIIPGRSNRRVTIQHDRTLS
jgi:hypothetical protein